MFQKMCVILDCNFLLKFCKSALYIIFEGIALLRKYTKCSLFLTVIVLLKIISFYFIYGEIASLKAKIKKFTNASSLFLTEVALLNQTFFLYYILKFVFSGGNCLAKIIISDKICFTKE